MFFRRQRSVPPSFSQRVEALREAGFRVEPQPGGEVKVSKGGCAAIVRAGAGEGGNILRLGVLVGSEIGRIVDGGFQKFLETPGGRRVPALASHLHALHAFEEDVRERLGLVSLYNQSLGTVNDLHRYDRVDGRDAGLSRRPWER